MRRSFAIVKNVAWFDNGTRPEFFILEMLCGWKAQHVSVCAGPFATKMGALNYIRDEIYGGE